jgi:hypothetical protein
MNMIDPKAKTDDAFSCQLKTLMSVNVPKYTLLSITDFRFSNPVTHRGLFNCFGEESTERIISEMVSTKRSLLRRQIDHNSALRYAKTDQFGRSKIGISSEYDDGGFDKHSDLKANHDIRVAPSRIPMDVLSKARKTAVVVDELNTQIPEIEVTSESIEDKWKRPPGSTKSISRTRNERNYTNAREYRKTATMLRAGDFVMKDKYFAYGMVIR